MATREKILDAAQDLIQTRSFHGFSFQDIADRVGVRKPSLYHYFDSKDAIALAGPPRRRWVSEGQASITVSALRTPSLWPCWSARRTGSGRRWQKSMARIL